MQKPQTACPRRCRSDARRSTVGASSAAALIVDPVVQIGTSRIIEWRGESRTMTEWSCLIGIPVRTLRRFAFLY